MIERKKKREERKDWEGETGKDDRTTYASEN